MICRIHSSPFCIRNDAEGDEGRRAMVSAGCGCGHSQAGVWDLHILLELLGEFDHARRHSPDLARDPGYDRGVVSVLSRISAERGGMFALRRVVLVCHGGRRIVNITKLC
jgi:hypothetical protein